MSVLTAHIFNNFQVNQVLHSLSTVDIKINIHKMNKSIILLSLIITKKVLEIVDTFKVLNIYFRKLK